MPEPLIRMTDVRYEYPKSGFRIECGNFLLAAGENALITGPNGSGKTTLCKLMCGILRPSSGDIFINGLNAQTLSLGRIGQTVGYLFQEPQKQLFTATVWEEMVFVDSVKGTDPKDTACRADSLLRRFGLFELKERSVYRLSRGEKQRLALCAIMMQGAKLLILDEPTTGLDRENRKILADTLKDLHRCGIGTAIVTHDKELMLHMGGRAVQMLSGKVIV